MAGNSKGKVLCGTPLEAGSNKKCTGCGTKNQPIPEEGKVCAKCGKFLAPWCEALVVPGGMSELSSRWNAVPTASSLVLATGAARA